MGFCRPRRQRLLLPKASLFMGTFRAEFSCLDLEPPNDDKKNTAPIYQSLHIFPEKMGAKKRGKPLYSLHFYFSEVETIRNFVVCFTLKFSECEAPLISNSFFFHVCIRQSIYPSKGLNIYRFPADGLTLNNIYHS